MIPISQAPLTVLLVIWQIIAAIGVVVLALAHKDGAKRPFFRRHRIVYGLIWLIVTPVAGTYLLLTLAGWAAILWIWIQR